MKTMMQCVLAATLALATAGLFAPASWAFSLNQPETLAYKISWGPLTMGHASFHYTPPAKANGPYQVIIALRDSSPLITLNSRYTSTGVHRPRPFTSQSYHALQRENDYRADKRVTFDAKQKQIRYTNQRDANDTAPPLAWDASKANALRDIFSQLYTMRVAGTAPLQTGQTLAVMGTKRPFTLLQQAPTKLAKANPSAPQLWQTVLRHRKEDGSLSKDSWHINLREEANGTLTPVRIQAHTKFGTFVATLQQ